MDDLDRKRIAEKAYELWEAEGRPEGREREHWVEAREIVALRDSFASTLTPVGQTTQTQAEPAIAYQNQGEFPQMSDQGEGARGPSLETAATTTQTQSLSDRDKDRDAQMPADNSLAGQSQDNR